MLLVLKQQEMLIVTNLKKIFFFTFEQISQIPNLNVLLVPCTVNMLLLLRMPYNIYILYYSFKSCLI